MHITSKYETPCNDCGELIEAGEKADWIKGQKGVWCLACHPTSTPLPGGPRRTSWSGPPNGQASAPLLTTAPLVAALTALEVAVKQLTVLLHERMAAKAQPVKDHEYRV